MSFPDDNTHRAIEFNPSIFKDPAFEPANAEFAVSNRTRAGAASVRALREHFKGLGFHAEIIGVGIDPENPTHPTCRVHVDTKSYIVDLGNFSSFAGPFSLEPGTVIESTGGEWVYTYQALPDLTHQMLSRRGEEQGRTHRSHSPVRELSFFEPAIQKSFDKETMFMNTLVCHRVLKGTPVYQWGDNLVTVEDGQIVKSKITGIADLERVYRDVLGVPKFSVREAVEVLREYNGVDVFSPKMTREG